MTGADGRPIHTIVFSRAADRSLASLPVREQARVVAAIDALAADPAGAANVKALKGRDAYRLRVGDLRVIYEFDGDAMVVLVLRIANRREAYR